MEIPKLKNVDPWDNVLHRRVGQMAFTPEQQIPASQHPYSQRQPTTHSFHPKRNRFLKRSIALTRGRLSSPRPKHRCTPFEASTAMYKITIPEFCFFLNVSPCLRVRLSVKRYPLSSRPPTHFITKLLFGCRSSFTSLPFIMSDQF
jgi:hypothetical protein